MHRRSLCLLDYSKWIHNSILATATSYKSSSFHSSFQGSSRYSVPGNSDLADKERYRKGACEEFSRILQPHLSSVKEERKTSTYHRLKCPESLRQNQEIQNGISEVSDQCYQSSRVCSVGGPVGCLLPYSHTSKFKEVPQICFRRPDFPVQMPSLRSQLQPSSVYTGDVQSDDPRQKDDRDLHVGLPRRRSAERSVTGEFMSGSRVLPQTNSTFRPVSKHGKVTASPSRRLCSHRHSVHYVPEQGLFNGGQGNQIAPSSSSIYESVKGDSQDFSVFTRHAQCSSRTNSFGQASSSSPPICSSVPMEGQNSTIKFSSQCHSANEIGLHSMAESIYVPSGSTVVSPSVSVHSSHGCEQFGLGGPSTSCGSHGPRDLVSKVQSSPYQSFGDESSLACSKILQTPFEEQVCLNQDGQRHCSFLHTPPRRYQVNLSHKRGVQTSPLDLSSQHYYYSVSHRGEAKCDFGQSISQRSNSINGMVYPSSDCGSNSENLGFAQHRSLCDFQESQAANLCLSLPGPSSLGSGRHDFSLDKPGSVCLSTFPSHTKSIREDQGLPVQGSSRGTLLVREVLDDGSFGSFVRLSPSSAPMAKTSETTYESEIPPESPVSPSSRMAVVRHAIRQKKFSQEVSERIANPRRQSSTKCYNAKWKIFSKWCSDKGLVPTQASIQSIADFLLYLFQDRQLKPVTIKGYRSAISDTLSHFGRDIGHDKYLSSLILSFDRDRPRPRSLAPKWNLAWVLNVLSGSPFEPIHIIDFKFLTYKTAFLLAFASARRVSELHALSVAPSCCRMDKNKVTLLTEPGFSSKNETASYRPSPIVIKSLAHFGNDSQSRCLCPRRALSVYLSRTKSIRGNRLRLFLPISKKSQDISVRTIARWITLAIKIAYNKLTDRDLSFMKIKAHEVRAVSTSWAHFNNCPLSDIMNAAFWRSETTFSSFYLRSLQEQADSIFQLGPIVAAQSVAGGPSE